jgi:uncharacterized membrane protein
MTTIGWVWLSVGWLLLVGAIVLAGWLIARSGRATEAPRTTPLDTLKERFARGEIDKDAYEAAKQTLTMP